MLTRRLLHDRSPAMVRRAVRALSSRADLGSVDAVAELLWHADSSVREAASQGLLRLGTAAVPTLRGVAARARPDRRRKLVALLEEIGDL